MRSRRFGGLQGRRRGQALVELAIALPILLLLVLGVVEFARAWNIKQAITDAAREGARIAAVFNETTTQAQVEDAVEQSISHAGFDPSVAVIDSPADPTALNTGDWVVVRIEYPYTFSVIRGLMNWVGGEAQITLRAASRFRKE